VGIRIEQNVKAIHAARDNTRALLVNVANTTAFNIQANAQELMRQPKSGRIYRQEQSVSFNAKGKQIRFVAYRGKKSHQASAPGEAPAVDTGALSNSIEVLPQKAVSRHARYRIVSAVTVNQNHGAVLELGGEKVAARPFLRPACEMEEENFYSAVGQAVQSGTMTHG
jgi:hypothetical protein